MHLFQHYNSQKLKNDIKLKHSNYIHTQYQLKIKIIKLILQILGQHISKDTIIILSLCLL